MKLTKLFIITATESYGEYVYAVWADSYEDAYEKFKKYIKEEDSYVTFNNDFDCTSEGASFTYEDCDTIVCDITTLKETEKVVKIGGYAE